jgi:arylsulfatase A-like enzyme
MLPIPDRPSPGWTMDDAEDPDPASPPIEALPRSAGAPRVLVVPAGDVASGGLRYSRFDTTAVCAPTRQALLTGRNHHSVGMGSIIETDASAPGQSSLRPNINALLAMTCKLCGSSTAQFGKCHEVPVWQSSPMGPFDACRSGGGGFETFYRFIDRENIQRDAALHHGTTPVEPPATAEQGYHLTEDLADHTVNWMRQQKELGINPAYGSIRLSTRTRNLTVEPARTSRG